MVAKSEIVRKLCWTPPILKGLKEMALYHRSEQSASLAEETIFKQNVTNLATKKQCTTNIRLVHLPSRINKLIIRGSLLGITQS